MRVARCPSTGAARSTCSSTECASRPTRLRAAMRRLIAIPLVLLALVIAGCGDDDSGSALDSALSYLPKDAPFAAAIDTDVEGDQYKALQALVKKFPFGEQLQDSLRQELEQSSGGVSFNDDVKPVLGNPFVVGATDAASFTSDSGASDFV